MSRRTLHFEDCYHQDATTSSVQGLFCICCLDTNVRLINLITCTHSEYLDNFLMPELKPASKVVCINCHVILKKIQQFKQQVENSFKMLSNMTSYTEDMNQRHNLKIHHAINIEIPENAKPQSTLREDKPQIIETEVIKKSSIKKLDSKAVALDIIKCNSSLLFLSAFTPNANSILDFINTIQENTEHEAVPPKKIKLGSQDKIQPKSNQPVSNKLQPDTLIHIDANKIQLDSNELQLESNLIKLEPNEIQPDSNEIQPNQNVSEPDPNDLQPDSNLVKLEPNEINSNSKDLQSDPNEIQTESNVMKLEPNEIQLDPNEIQTESNVMKLEPNEIQLDPNEIQTESNVMKLEPNEIQLDPNELQTESNVMKLEPNEIQLDPNELQSDPNELQPYPNDLQPESNLIKHKPHKLQSNLTELKLDPNEILTEADSNLDKTLSVPRGHRQKLKMLTITETELELERRLLAMTKQYFDCVYKCSDCIIGFRFQDNYNDHMKRKHSVDLGSIVCQVCSQRFTSYLDYRFHLLRHFTRYQCVKCKELFQICHEGIQHYHVKHGMKRIKIKSNRVRSKKPKIV